MPAAADAAQPPSTQNGDHREEDWPEDVSQPSTRREDRMQFSGDGLNTGVRVLSRSPRILQIDSHRIEC